MEKHNLFHEHTIAVVTNLVMQSCLKNRTLQIPETPFTFTQIDKIVDFSINISAKDKAEIKKLVNIKILMTLKYMELEGIVNGSAKLGEFVFHSDEELALLNREARLDLLGDIESYDDEKQ